MTLASTPRMASDAWNWPGGLRYNELLQTVLREREQLDTQLANLESSRNALAQVEALHAIRHNAPLSPTRVSASSPESHQHTASSAHDYGRKSESEPRLS